MVLKLLELEGISVAEAYCDIAEGGVGGGLESNDIACARFCYVVQRVLNEQSSVRCSSGHLPG